MRNAWDSADATGKLLLSAMFGFGTEQLAGSALALSCNEKNIGSRG